ncbi:MAG: hypothetical protein ACK55Z_20890, partial [bacterium]
DVDDLAVDDGQGVARDHHDVAPGVQAGQHPPECDPGPGLGVACPAGASCSAGAAVDPLQCQSGLEVGLVVVSEVGPALEPAAVFGEQGVCLGVGHAGGVG